jgi:glycosyltransferase involved in cell wall biosynthesis
MAAGLPVIAYDLPAYRKIYSDSYKAIECFNHEMFAKAIIDILDNTSAYSDLKSKGLATAAKYDWDEIAENDRDFLL